MNTFGTIYILKTSTENNIFKKRMKSKSLIWKLINKGYWKGFASTCLKASFSWMNGIGNTKLCAFNKGYISCILTHPSNPNRLDSRWFILRRRTHTQILYTSIRYELDLEGMLLKICRPMSQTLEPKQWRVLYECHQCTRYSQVYLHLKQEFRARRWLDHKDHLYQDQHILQLGFQLY